MGRTMHISYPAYPSRFLPGHAPTLVSYAKPMRSLTVASHPIILCDRRDVRFQDRTGLSLLNVAYQSVR